MCPSRGLQTETWKWPLWRGRLSGTPAASSSAGATQEAIIPSKGGAVKGISHNRRRITGRVVRVGSTLRPPFRDSLRARDRATRCAPGRYGAASGVSPGVPAVTDEVLPVLSLRADPQGRPASRPYAFGPARLLRRLRRLAMTGSGVRHRRRSLVGDMSADRVGGAVAECDARGTTPSGNELLLLRTRHRPREERRGHETLPRAGPESRQMVAVYTDDSGTHPGPCSRRRSRWRPPLPAVSPATSDSARERAGRGAHPARARAFSPCAVCTRWAPRGSHSPAGRSWP